MGLQYMNQLSEYIMFQAAFCSHYEKVSDSHLRVGRFIQDPDHKTNAMRHLGAYANFTGRSITNFFPQSQFCSELHWVLRNDSFHVR